MFCAFLPVGGGGGGGAFFPRSESRKEEDEVRFDATGDYASERKSNAVETESRGNTHISTTKKRSKPHSNNRGGQTEEREDCMRKAKPVAGGGGSGFACFGAGMGICAVSPDLAKSGRSSCVSSAITTTNEHCSSERASSSANTTPLIVWGVGCDQLSQACNAPCCCYMMRSRLSRAGRFDVFCLTLLSFCLLASSKFAFQRFRALCSRL